MPPYNTSMVTRTAAAVTSSAPVIVCLLLLLMVSGCGAHENHASGHVKPRAERVERPKITAPKQGILGGRTKTVSIAPNDVNIMFDMQFKRCT